VPNSRRAEAFIARYNAEWLVVHAGWPLRATLNQRVEAVGGSGRNRAPLL